MRPTFPEVAPPAAPAVALAGPQQQLLSQFRRQRQGLQPPPVRRGHGREAEGAQRGGGEGEGGNALGGSPVGGTPTNVSDVR